MRALVKDACIVVDTALRERWQSGLSSEPANPVWQMSSAALLLRCNERI